MKLVTDKERTHANMMNVVAMVKYRDKAPTNALIAQAVRSCAARGIRYLAYQGFTYTTKEKVVDIGPVHVTAEKTKTLPLPPILGVVAVASGLALLFLGFTLLVFWKHRANIARLFARTEPRVGAARHG